MHAPRHTLFALAAAGAGLSLAVSLAVAPGAGSATPQERTPSTSGGTAGAKTYHQLARKKDYVRLDLLALNDFHGNLQPPSGSGGQINSTKAGGAAFLANLLNRERRKSRAAGATPLTVAAGDLIGASPLLSAAFHDEPTIAAMNQLQLDVSSVGNHEFDEGVTELLRMQKGGCLPDGPNGVNGQNSCPGTQDFKGADFKYLGANVAWKNAAGHPRPTPFRPYQIFHVKGQKVAFIGMTLEGTPAIVSQAGIADVQFNDEIETANALVPKLRKKGVKSIVVLLHEGVTPTDTTAYNSCSGVSGPGLAIAQGLAPQIDAVVSGHTHQPYNCVVKDPKGRPRLFTSASSFGRMVTKLHLLIDPKTHDVVRPAAFAENIVNASGEGQKQSAKVNKLIDVFNTLVQPIANAVIGHVEGPNPTTVSKKQEADGSDSPLGNLIADSQKADPSVVRNGQAPVIALMNPGGIRADLVENAAGEVTYGAAFTVQPFNNFVVSMDLTGAQIRALLNEQWNGANEPTATTGPKILQVSGIKYTWNTTLAKGAGDAIVGDVLVDHDGNPSTAMVALDPTATYRVVANNFLSDGGDSFATFKAGTNKLIGGLDIDSLRIYLQGHDPYTVTATDRISSVN
jgi:5'-nucleotidase